MGNEEKKGFAGFFKRLKEENKGFGSTMKRINSSGFCGNINRGVKDGDFWNGSYISIEDGHAVIYGSNQEDYPFAAGDVVSLTPLGQPGKAQISSGNQKLPGTSYELKLKDGKTAYIDLITAKESLFRSTLKL